MSGNLRRPGDTPDQAEQSERVEQSEHVDEPQWLSESYIDRADDIFDGRGDRGPVDRDESDGPDSQDHSGDDDVEVPFEFDPWRAGLEDISVEEAARYVAENKDARPWLAVAADRHPQVRRVYAALDRGQGHAIPRHDDYGDDSMYARRVRYLEDPAQLDEVKRAAGIDGTKPGDKPHFCGPYAARIHDADAFALAFARGIEHPSVRAVLDRPYEPDYKPPRRLVAISDLLGDDGHWHCSGYQLVGDPETVINERKAWINAEARAGLTEPQAEPIPTFEGGKIEFRFRRNRAGDGYEVSTTFPQPPTPPSEETRK